MILWLKRIAHRYGGSDHEMKRKWDAVSIGEISVLKLITCVCRLLDDKVKILDIHRGQKSITNMETEQDRAVKVLCPM